jgi:integrase
MPMLGEPSQWDAAGLRSAFQRRSKETPGSASLLVTIMRSYIRFLVVRGECRPALLHAVPSVQRYRLSTLPRHVDPATIERIIAACPTDRPVEVRDKAIILLLARLGLRAADIQDMRLDDIDWRSGHLTVKGKTRRPDRLPLPQDVGDAIWHILRQPARRPPKSICSCAQAPFRPFRSSAEIAGIVARTRDRGGIEGVPTGSHIFRHSLATNLLRAGAGLESVGTILRHSSPETTAIYAKVDLPMLMKIAQPGRENRHAEHTHLKIRRAASQPGSEVSEQDRMLASTPLRRGFRRPAHQVQRIYDWCHTASSQYVARHRFDTAQLQPFRSCRRFRPRSSACRRLRPGKTATPDADHHRTGTRCGRS